MATSAPNGVAAQPVAERSRLASFWLATSWLSRPASQAALLVALTLAIYLGSAFAPALLDDADSAHAEAAREMIERGDWVTLRLNGIRYLEKAPLLYWSIAVCFKLLGVWELPARLPLVLASAAFTLVMFALGRLLFGERAGFYAGLAAPTCFGVYLFTRILIPEILLALFLSAAYLCFLAAEREASQTRAALLYYGMYASVALAVLTKGLIGVLFPAGTVGLYLLLAGRLRLGTLRRMRLATGSLLFVAIAAPWHLLATLRTEKFFWFYFINEHLLRYVGRRVPMDYGKVPLLLFWGLHLVWVFPWTAFLMVAFREFPRRLPKTERERALLFLWLWAGLVLVFFSFSTRQEYYTFPAYPALILLAGQALAGREAAPGKALRISQWALAAVATAVAAGLLAMVAASLGRPAEGDIAGLLSRNEQHYVLSLGHFLDLTPESFAALRGPAIGAALVLLAGAWLSLWLRITGRHRAAALALALMSAGFFLCANEAYKVFNPILSSRELARRIQAVFVPGDRMVINGEYESGSTLNFYTGRQVLILNGRSANLWFGSWYPDAPKIFLENSDLARIWREPGRVFLFTPAEQKPKLEALVGPARVFASSGGKLILTNR
jgi:4-amino-4-deoxy-L-arabinose transferase-like glycosyltransferase